MNTLPTTLDGPTPHDQKVATRPRDQGGAPGQDQLDPSAASLAAARFADAPEARVRSLLRYAGREGLSLESLSSRLGEAAPQVLAELIARGFVEPTPIRGRHPHTLRGRGWAAAPSEKLYRLASAQRATLGLVAKARSMNASEDALFLVERIVLFGEILAAPAVLRSVDVGVDLVRAPRALQRAERGAEEENRRERRKTTSAEWLAARERGVWAFLGARSPVLRLLPLVGDAWPHGAEVYPTSASPSVLTCKPRRP